MTVTVSGVVRNVSGVPDRSKWFFTSELRGSGDSSAIVSPNTRIATPNVDGVLTVELDPGPVTVKYGNEVIRVTVPNSDIDLWTLIEAGVIMPPAATDAKIAAAVAAYLEAWAPQLPTVTWATIDKPAFVAAGPNAASARDAIGAASSAYVDARESAIRSDTTAAVSGVSQQLSAVDAAIRGDFGPAVTAAKDRANHVGTQTSATISDFAEAAQDAVAAMLQGASGVSLSYNDAANTLTITGGGAGGLDAEAVRDTIGVALIGAGLINVVVNDAADTITITTTATQNATDAALRDRSTHTGTQTADTITETTAVKMMTAAERTKLAQQSGTNTGDQTSVTGNAGTATKLATARTINGVAFDGTANVTIADPAAVPKALVDAKGDLLVGTADNVLARLGVGTDGQVLTADAAQAGGVKWSTPAAGGGGGAGSYVFAQNVGDGTTGPFTITHNFGSTNIFVQVWKNAGAGLTSAAPNSLITATPTIIDGNNIRLSPAEAWAVNEFRVIVTLVTAATVADPLAALPIRGLWSARPAAGVNGRTFFCIDNGNEYRDNGTTWDLVSLGQPYLGSPTGGFTAANLGSATFTEDRDTLLLAAPSNGSTNNVRQNLRTLTPASGYTLIAYIDPTSVPSANYWEAGLVLKAASGAMILFTWRYGDGLKLNVVKYNSATAASTSYATPAVSAFPPWLRIQDNGTNRIYSYSYNGWDWTVVATTSRTDFITPNQYGIAADPYSQPVSIRVRSLLLV